MTFSPRPGITIPRRPIRQSPSHLPRHPSLLQNLRGRALQIATTLISSRGQQPLQSLATRRSTLPSTRRATSQRIPVTLRGSRASPQGTVGQAPSAQAQPLPWDNTPPSIAALPRVASATRQPQDTRTPINRDTLQATRRGTRITRRATLGRRPLRDKRAHSSAPVTRPRGAAVALLAHPDRWRGRATATVSRRRYNNRR